VLPFAFAFSSHSAKPVSSGRISLKTIFFNLPVLQQSFDLCQLTQCPLPSGPAHLEINLPSGSVPVFAPTGQYETEAILTDGTGSQLSCTRLFFSIV
jgi:hypothetical protein